MNSRYIYLTWSSKDQTFIKSSREYESYEEAELNAQHTGKKYIIEPVRHKLLAINPKIQCKQSWERFHSEPTRN